VRPWLEGSLPWRLPKDMAYFKAVTSQVHEPGARNAVVGPRTLENVQSHSKSALKKLESSHSLVPVVFLHTAQVRAVHCVRLRVVGNHRNSNPRFLHPRNSKPQFLEPRQFEPPFLESNGNQ